jgi:hypothetical protein
MRKIKTGKTWTIPKRVLVHDLPLRSALESYLDYLLACATYGRKLGALGYLVFDAFEKVRALEADKSIPQAAKKRLIKMYLESVGAPIQAARRRDKSRRELVNIIDLRGAPQANQIKVFQAYRAVLRREGRPPMASEWLDEDLNARKTRVSDSYRKDRDLVLREMARRFKLPITKQRDIRAKQSAS